MRQYTNGGVKLVLTKEYKGRFFMIMSKLPVLYKHKKENKKNVTDII